MLLGVNFVLLHFGFLLHNSGELVDRWDVVGVRTLLGGGGLLAEVELLADLLGSVLLHEHIDDLVRVLVHH